jgi:hypothetical protein
MSKVLGEYVQDFVELYLDDMLVHASTESELVSRLRKVFERLNTFGIKLNPKKCRFV